MTGGYRAGSVVVTVEHASPRVPAALSGLGLAVRWFESHYAWDPGAAAVGRALARAFAATLHLAPWSRLVADLNRSSNHPNVVPRVLQPAGKIIPANVDLDRAARQERLARYWHPWRRAVAVDLDAAVHDAGVALHISVHSFVERLRGTERSNHFGLLYDPARRRERDLADRLHARLAAMGFLVRRNYPYSGLDDGHCMRLRRERPGDLYLGMEIEMNQRWSRTEGGRTRLARGLIDAFAPELPA